MGTGLGLLVRDRKTESGRYGGGTKGPGDGRWVDQRHHPGFQRELGPAAPAHASYQPGDLNF